MRNLTDQGEPVGVCNVFENIVKFLEAGLVELGVFDLVLEDGGRNEVGLVVAVGRVDRFGVGCEKVLEGEFEGLIGDFEDNVLIVVFVWRFSGIRADKTTQ